MSIFEKEKLINGFWRSLQIFGKQGISLIIFFLVAKLLLPYDLGLYSYIMASIFMLVMFSDFGIASATSKYVAEYNAIDKAKLKKLIFNSSMIILSLGILIILAALLFGQHFFKDNYDYVLIALPIILLYPLTSLLDGVYAGLKRFRELAVITVSLGIASIIYFYFLVQYFGVKGAIMAHALYYLSLVIALSLRLKLKQDYSFDRDVLKSVTWYSFIIGLGSVGAFLYTRIDVLVMGRFGLIQEISYYEFAYRIFTLMIMPAMIFGTVVAPNTTADFAKKKYSDIRKRMLKEAGLLFAIGLVGCIFAYFLIRPVFSIAFPQYDANLLMVVVSYLLFLVPLRLFSTFISVGYIVPSGHAMITTALLLVFGVLNLILDIILIQIYGFMGIIYATLISQILLIIFKDPYFYYKINKLIEAKQ